MTCLMCACQFGWIRVTEELLKRRCHIHRAMMVGNTQDKTKHQPDLSQQAAA